VKVAGVLHLDADAPSFEGGIARVTVEEVGRVDAAATMVAEVRIAQVVHRQGVSEQIAFVLDCPEPPPRSQWSVRASIDHPLPGQFTTDRASVNAQSIPLALRLHCGPGVRT
jgi:hypothetical protein